MGDMNDQVSAADWLTVPEVAELWGSDVLRVRQALKDRHLLASRSEGVLRIPRAFLAEDGPVKGLPGVLTLLFDGGFTDEEALRWLLTPDETIPGTPAQALGENRGTEIKRRAQALAY
jgi:hypothetical protein